MILHPYSVAVDEPVSGTMIPSDMLAICRVERIEPGSWLALPGDCWGVKLMPQPLWMIGLGGGEAFRPVWIDEYMMRYWTSEQEAKSALDALRQKTVVSEGDK